MLRVILDEHGSSAKDLFVKIDTSPCHVWVVDTSWLGWLFDTDDGSVASDEEMLRGKKADVASLIQLWQEMLLSDRSVCYLPYDLSDQYVGVLKVAKGKKLHRVSRLWSLDICGNLTLPYFLQVQESVSWQKGIEQGLEWLIAPSSILTGLRWSLAQLEQPTVPLRYD